jgi:hypothetical protein
VSPFIWEYPIDICVVVVVPIVVVLIVSAVGLFIVSNRWLLEASSLNTISVEQT